MATMATFLTRNPAIRTAQTNLRTPFPMPTTTTPTMTPRSFDRGTEGFPHPSRGPTSEDFYAPWAQDVETAKWMAEMASTGRLTDFLTANLVAFGGANAADRAGWGTFGPNGMLNLPSLFVTPPRPEQIDPREEDAHRRRSATLLEALVRRGRAGMPHRAEGVLVGERGRPEVLIPRGDGSFEIVPITQNAATGGSFTTDGGMIRRRPALPTRNTYTRTREMERPTSPTPTPTPTPTPGYPTSDMFRRIYPGSNVPTPAPTPTPTTPGGPVTPPGQQPIVPTPRDPNLLPSIRALQDDRVIPAFGELGARLSLAPLGIEGEIPAPYRRAANFWRQPSWIQDQMIQAWQSAIGGGIPASQIIQWLQEATPGFRRSPTRVMRLA